MSRRSARRTGIAALALAGLLAGCGSQPARQSAVMSCRPASPPSSVALARGAQPGARGTDPAYRGPQVRHGGPVQADPKVVLVFWGRQWLTGAFQCRVRDAEQAMLSKLAGSEWGAVLGQYGVHDDIRLIRTWIDPAGPPERKLGYKAMLAEAHRASVQTAISPGVDVQWILFPPPTANLAAFADECGEHDSNTGRYHQTFVYDLVQPFDTRRFGSGGDSCAQYDGYGNDKVAATTSLTSHEIAEAATDPLDLKGGNGSGWWGPSAAKRFGMGAAEIGDFCYAQAVQPWGPDGPTVQALWSDANSVAGDRGCVQSPAGGPLPIVGQTTAVGPNGTPAPLPASSPAARARLLGGR